MKRLIIKLLSLIICIRYSLLAKANFSESNDPDKLRTKLTSISKSLQFFSFGGIVAGESTMTVGAMYAKYGTFLTFWLRLEAIVLAYSVYQLLRGRKIGPFLMMLVTLIGITVEANPLADYNFEMDKTEAVK